MAAYHTITAAPGESRFCAGGAILVESSPMKKLPTIRGWRHLCDVVDEIGFLPFQEAGK